MSNAKLSPNFSPSLIDLINAAKREVNLDLNCHAIAKIDSFDSTTCTCSAKLVYNRTYYKLNNQGVVIENQFEYPPLFEVPVFIFGGGESFLSFPIAPGDECQIHFCDRDIDNWVRGAKSGPVNSPRLHAFTDGIAVVGFKKPTSYDASRARLQNNLTYVGVGDGKVKIANATDSLGLILQNLATDLNTFSDPTGLVAATDPGTTMALANALLARFTALNLSLTTTHQTLTKLQGLLE